MAMGEAIERAGTRRRRRGRSGALAALLAVSAALVSMASGARAQVRQELERRMFDERGRPIPESRKEKCKRQYDRNTSACVSRALENPDLKSSDFSFYKQCASQYEADYNRCLNQGGGAR